MRKNCTSGTVRGAPGNRRSYRRGPSSTGWKGGMPQLREAVVIGKTAFEFPIRPSAHGVHPFNPSRGALPRRFLAAHRGA
jgi:hypothetical protein